MGNNQYAAVLLSLLLALPAAGGEPDWDGIERQMLQPKKCPPGARLVQADHPDQGYTQACLDVRSRLSGWALVFYPNGQAKEYSEGTGGQNHGKIMGWYENGQRKFFYEYQNGEKHGLAVQWFENGQKMSEGRYRRSFRDGPWRYWFSSGQLRKRGQFRQDRESGKWEYWGEDGAASDHEIFPRPAEKPARPARAEGARPAETPPKELQPGVLIGAPLVARELVLQEPSLGAIKQMTRGGGADLWLVGEKGALLVDAGYSPRKRIDFPRPAIEASLLDLEGDGKEEFLFRSRALTHHGFFELTCLLDSAGAERRLSPPLWGTRLPAAGDIDSDGRAELVAPGSWQKGDSADFERGIVVMDSSGKIRQEILAEGLDQVFLADRDGDGRPDIVSFDSRGYLQVHAPAGITSFITKIEHPVSEATLCPWPDGRQRPHLLYLYETSVWLVDTLTGESLRFDAPMAATGSVAGALGVPVRLRRERRPYLAVAARLETRQSLLYLLTPRGRVEYLEVIDEPVEALAALESSAGAEELLVGGRGRVWSYRFLEEQWEDLAEAVWRVLAFGTPEMRLADVKIKNTARQLSDGWYEWTVYIEGSEEALSQIGCVQYSLSPSFPDANQLVCERGPGPRHFALTREGWGMFTLPVRLYLKSGPVQELYHRIRF